MTHWNYRILSKKVNNDIEYGLYEVYYDDNDIPNSSTKDTMKPVSFDSDIEDPVKAIKWQLDAMKLACEKPVLDYDNFPKENVKYLRRLKLKEIGKQI